MVTLKQVEAVYWVHALGSFAAAADRLNTTQSTISKRVLELEHQFGVEIFDRRSLQGTLTLKGREIIEDFSSLLRLRDHIVLTIGSTETYSGRLRFGLTEMVALTWLPALLAAIKTVYPRITLEPRIDIISNMLPQLLRHNLDVVIGPVPDSRRDCCVVDLGGLDYAWMASPQVLEPEPDDDCARWLVDLPLLTYGEDSMLYQHMQQDLTRLGLTGSKFITCNSMVSLAELARAGLGATYIPRDYFAQYVRSGELREIPISPSPPLHYAAFHLNNPVCQTIADLARDACDFASMQFRPPQRRANTRVRSA